MSQPNENRFVTGKEFKDNSVLKNLTPILKKIESSVHPIYRRCIDVELSCTPELNK